MQSSYAYGHWMVVAVNILFFTIFVVGFLVPIKKREWRSLGIFEAFIVALYVEMYGFPLTIYTITSVFGRGVLGSNPLSHGEGHLWATLLLGSRWAMTVCFLGSLLVILSMILIALGWWKIYRGRSRLVTDGIYRRVRHPQYLGLMLFVAGMLIQWPTIITFIMWPVLIVAYYRLAMREEKELEAKFGENYQEYKRHTSAFIPFKIRDG